MTSVGEKSAGIELPDTATVEWDAAGRFRITDRGWRSGWLNDTDLNWSWVEAVYWLDMGEARPRASRSASRAIVRERARLAVLESERAVLLARIAELEAVT